jgi:hypothetical protein
MLVAKQKRKENIAEYILYLYQVEDMIRAFQFDFNQIDEKLISAYKTDAKTREEIRNWYSNLVIMMEKEGIRAKGHLQFLVNMVDDVNDFHLKLMETGQDAAYVQIFTMVAGIVDELKKKNPDARNDFELGITAIYGYLLLKMQQREVSDDTTGAVKMLSNWLAHLSKLYRDFETGDFSFE